MESVKIQSVVPITFLLLSKREGEKEKWAWPAVGVVARCGGEVIRAWWRSVEGPLVAGVLNGRAAADAQVGGCCLQSTLDRDEDGV